MKNTTHTLFYFFIVVLLISSCKKEEVLRDAPEVISSFSEEPVYQSVAEMGSDYQDQIYFSFEQESAIFSHLKTDWDLSFATQDNAWEIRLNSSRLMKVWKSSYTAINEITTQEDIENDNWLYDTPDGSMEGNAFGNWQNNNTIYVLDMGVNNIDGSSYGFYKCRIISVDETAYSIELAAIEATEWTKLNVPKIKSQSEVLLSLKNRKLVERPDADQYSLFFTQYTHIFDEAEGPLPYLVTGALINKQVEVAVVSDKNFDEINTADIGQYSFTTNLDAIGYSWKDYDLDLGIFTVFPEINYLLKTPSGSVYKVHFIDFYNNQGIKGFPKLEFQKIKEA